ncbi:HD domain-containing protein [Candidatus Woesearchaeota archaeon]|nr:HD domain-containing protein [Candidatus Woesearchaeota archaeon]
MKELKKDIKEYFTHRSHGFDHVMRVYRVAVKIAEKEKADLKLVKAAALLHDIARTGELNGKDVCHAEKGAEMCIPILKKHNFKDDEIKIISDAIKTHRYKNQLKPVSKTGKILQDADRLDVLGTMGIARIFSRSGELNLPFYDPNQKPAEEYESRANTAINHFYEKILKITPDTFHTETAKKIAKSRYKYTKEFIQRFLKEWEGDI